MRTIAGLPITEQQLREALRTMQPRQKLFDIIKDELTARGYWRPLPRGNPAAGYAAAQAKKTAP